MKILIIDNQQLTIKSLIFALGNYKEIYMKKTILTVLCMVAVATAQAQINIGKMASAATPHLLAAHRHHGRL